MANLLTEALVSLLINILYEGRYEGSVFYASSIIMIQMCGQVKRSAFFAKDAKDRH